MNHKKCNFWLINISVINCIWPSASKILWLYLVITRNPKVIWEETSPPLTAENGLNRCLWNAHCRQVQSLSRRYVTSTPRYHIASHNFAQLCHKVPISYNGLPHIDLQNCPFPFDNLHPSNTPILDWTHSPCQTASRSISRFSTIHPLDRSTNRQTDRQMG